MWVEVVIEALQLIAKAYAQVVSGSTAITTSMINRITLTGGALLPKNPPPFGRLAVWLYTKRVKCHGCGQCVRLLRNRPGDTWPSPYCIPIDVDPAPATGFWLLLPFFWSVSFVPRSPFINSYGPRWERYHYRTHVCG